ncbi:MAG TPA: MFS transporter, partial [Gemmataceae bacterium]|nr:MFS transporter [Gemmataceae bacterium]
MHDESSPPVKITLTGGPWWRQLNRYHWFVLFVAALGWMFDTMDQQLFNIARRPAMRKLLQPAPGVEPERQTVDEYSGWATSIFLIGWGTGGIAFGILGDLIGRAKTMMLTILVYSLFTGLSALSKGFLDFAFYRFLTGLGVGGEFAVGVSLVAEVMPDQARPFALGLLQALSAVGNITAAATGIILAYLARAGIIRESWRIMFVVGAVPALLSIFVFWKLKEPERWRQAAAKYTLRERLRSYFGELFSNPRWTKNAIVGLILAAAGIIGLWGIGFFSIDLQRAIFRARFTAEGLSGPEITFSEDVWAGWTSVMLNVGAFLGIYAFSYVTHYIGRKPAFAIAFVLALLSTAFVFWKLNTIGDIFWMIPLMGFCQLALFGGYAIYFPELFPTRLRSTGTSFCYNVARFAAAFGPAALGLLTSKVFTGYAEPMRYAGITMCSVFLLGLLILPFAPETR